MGYILIHNCLAVGKHTASTVLFCAELLFWNICT